MKLASARRAWLRHRRFARSSGGRPPALSSAGSPPQIAAGNQAPADSESCLCQALLAAASKILQGVAVFCVGMGIVAGAVSADDMVHRMDGYVKHVDPEKRELVVLFEHPVTEEIMEKEFFILESAGFKDFKKLSDLKENDLLTVDYREHEPRADAIYVIRVPIDKSYVSAGELADALTQIRPGKEK